MNHRTFAKLTCVAMVVTFCSYVYAGNNSDPNLKLSLDNRFNRIVSLTFQTKDYDNVIKKLEAFAKEHPKHDLAAEARLKIADILARRKKNIDDAIEKLKWVSANFPKAKKKQYLLRGWCPSTMYEEWRDYVNEHPILIKDYAWYKLASLYKNKKVKRYEDALAAYDHILSTVKPDKLPDTKNEAIVTTFRLHKAAFESKMALLRRMKRQAHLRKKIAEVKKVTAEIKKAATEFEKLYPKAAWKKLRLEANAAFNSYIEKDKKLKKLKEQEELRRMKEEDKQHAEKQKN